MSFFIRGVRLENVCQFESIEKEFSQGIVVVTGENGVGKTNFLRGCEFAVIGDCDIPKKSLIRRGCNKMNTEARVCVNDQPMTIKREYPGSVVVVEKGGETKNHAFTKFLANMNNDGYDLQYIFRYALIRQGQLTRVVEATQSQQLAEFETLFQLDRFEKIAKTVSSKTPSITPVSIGPIQQALEGVPTKAQLDEKEAQFYKTCDLIKPGEIDKSSHDMWEFELETTENKYQSMLAHNEFVRTFENAIGISQELIRLSEIGKQFNISSELRDILDTMTALSAQLIKDVNNICFKWDGQVIDTKEIENKIKALKDMVAAPYRDLSKAKYQIDLLRAELNAMHQAYQSSERLRKAFDEAVETHRTNEKLLPVVDALQRVSAACRKDGIPASIISANSKRILRQINNYLEMFSADFRMNRFLDSAIVAGEEYSTKSLSGGQKITLGLSYHLSVNDLLTDGMNFIALDEPTIYLDQRRIEQLAEILNCLAAEHPEYQIMVVTHDTVFSEMLHTDQVLEL